MARPPLGLIASLMRKLPLGAIGMLALVVLAERGVGRSGASYRSLLAWNGHLARRSAATEATKARVLFLGDSLVKLGLIPELFDAESGKSSYNLAVLAAEPPATYFLFRRVLESGGRPESIVVDFAPNLAHGDPRGNLPALAEAWDVRDALDLALSARDADFFARWLASASIPSIRHREAIRERFLASLKGRDSVEPLRKQAARQEGQVRRHWALHRGATVLAGPGVTLPLRADLEDPYLRAPFAFHPLNAAYVDRLLDLADARGIRVYWLVPACVADTQAKRERLGIDAASADFVRSRQARHPRLVALDARKAGYPNTFFVDGGHLNRRGAVAQTREIAELFKKEPETTWITLNRSRDRGEDAGIEDFGESSRLAEARASMRKR